MICPLPVRYRYRPVKLPQESRSTNSFFNTCRPFFFPIIAKKSNYGDPSPPGHILRLIHCIRLNLWSLYVIISWISTLLSNRVWKQLLTFNIWTPLLTLDEFCIHLTQQHIHFFFHIPFSFFHLPSLFYPLGVFHLVKKLVLTFPFQHEYFFSEPCRDYQFL